MRLEVASQDGRTKGVPILQVAKLERQKGEKTVSYDIKLVDSNSVPRGKGRHKYSEIRDLIDDLVVGKALRISLEGSKDAQKEGQAILTSCRVYANRKDIRVVSRHPGDGFVYIMRVG
jgi:hypothetical protein